MTKPEPVKPPVSAPSPDASRQPPPAERPIADPSFATAPSRATVAEVESVPSARVARGRGEPQRSAAVPKEPTSSVPRTSRVAAAAPPAAVLSPNRAAQRWTSPPPPAPTPVRVEPVPDDLAIERDDAGYGSSRLGSLRNLLVSLGRRSLSKDGDSALESDSHLDPRFEKATMRPAYAETSLPETDVPGSSVPVRLTAQPEFLPPKPTVEVEKEKETVRPTPPRRDNPDGDEIQTLPSWRGQYRKKRYPPI